MREHITSNKKVGTRYKLGYLVPPLSLTERQITLEVRQCKADIDIHHGEHGEHGVPCTEVRGNNILSPWYNPRYDNYHI